MLSPLRWRALQLIVDSPGLKLNGPGEWLVEKHGTTKRRSWHKLHIGLDAVSGEIVASTLTGRDIDDDSQVATLLDQVDGSVGVFLGDGAGSGANSGRGAYSRQISPAMELTQHVEH